MATPLQPPPRDLRLDVMRGWMQLSIFVSHITGSLFFFGIHAAWGLSDSSEQFILLSGFGLGSLFTLKQARGGFGTAWQDLRQRTWRLWLTHMLVFFMFAALVLAVTLTGAAPGECARLGWGWFAEKPWFAIPAGAIALYQPQFIGILPLFIVCMLVLPGFMWLAERWGAWALMPSFLLWLAVQFGLLWTPGLGGTLVAFDPLAWQFLYMIGAYAGRQSLLSGGQAVRQHPLLVAGALILVVVGLGVRLVEHGLLPGDMAAAAHLYEGKTFLAPLPLLHALSLAYLVAVLVPRDQRWMHGAVGNALATLGRQSLHVFCLGLFLSWGVSIMMMTHPEMGRLLDLGLVPLGVMALVMFARAQERRMVRAKAARA
jgi:hypothetical protein